MKYKKYKCTCRGGDNLQQESIYYGNSEVSCTVEHNR